MLDTRKDRPGTGHSLESIVFRVVLELLTPYPWHMRATNNAAHREDDGGNHFVGEVKV